MSDSPGLVSLPADVLWGRNECVMNESQRVSEGRGYLVGFAIGLLIFVLNLHDRQVLFSGEIQITDGL